MLSTKMPMRVAGAATPLTSAIGRMGAVIADSLEVVLLTLQII
jgi:hypothetical protein